MGISCNYLLLFPQLLAECNYLTHLCVTKAIVKQIYAMQVEFQFFIDDLEQNYFSITADVARDISIGSSDLVVDLCAIELNGCMGIRLSEVPAEIKNLIDEQARTEWNRQKEMQRSSRPGKAHAQQRHAA